MLLMAEPNVAEGQDEKVLKDVKRLLSSGAMVVREEVREEANRSAFLLLGSADDIMKSLLALYEYGKARDVSLSSGGYPRIGFVDIVPIYPLPGRDIGPALSLGTELARRAADLGYPVYLCGELARDEDRRTPWSIRNESLQWEELRETLREGRNLPDMGPREMPPFGATIISVTPYPLKLIAKVSGNPHRLAARLRDIRGMNVSAVEGELAIRYTGRLSLSALLSVMKAEAGAEGLSILSVELCGLLPSSLLVREASRLLGTPLNEDAVVEWLALDYLLERGDHESVP